MRGISKLLTAALMLVGLAVTQQAPAGSPAGNIDAASIKPNNSGSHSSSSHSDKGRITMENVTLKGLIQTAFSLLPYQVVGPTWMQDVHFDAVVTFANVPPDQPFRTTARLMQAWLIDQFQLKFHHETRPEPGYYLIVAKGGPKLTPGPSCCSYNTTSADGGLVKLTADTDMASFVTNLGLRLDRPVLVDKTGIEGNYHIEMTFVPDTLSAGSSDGASALPPGPSIYDALHELGLRLEAATFPTDILVIDDAQRSPKGN